MKKNDRIIKAVSGSPCVTAAFFLVLLGGLYANPASAQGDRRGGERNGTVREGGTKQNTFKEQPSRIQREKIEKPDVAVNRNNPGRNFNHPPNEINTERNINRNLNNNRADVNRGRNNNVSS